MMFTFEVQTPVVAIVSRGMETKIDLSKLSHDILRSLLAHGVTQKVSDAASQAAAVACEAKFGAEYNRADAKAWLETDGGKTSVGNVTLSMMEKAIDALYAGTWSMRQGGGLRIESDPVTKLAHDKAKATLMAMFKAAAAKAKVPSKIADMVKLSPKIAAFFTDKAKWDESKVAEYITAQAVAGRDYRAEALAEYNANLEAVGEVNLDDLLGDL